MMRISIADYEIAKILLGERVKQVEQLEKQNADLVAALGRLVLAFDVGDMAHTTLNGRGYSALADARPLLDIEEE